MGPAVLRDHIHQLADSRGFERCGVVPAGPLPRRQYLREWLDAGRAGSMDYLHRHFGIRCDSRELLAKAKSIIVVALSYHQAPGPSADGSARIAMYAWGKDYHKVMKRKLFALVDDLRATIDVPFDSKVCVDTAPLIEREAAELAGIGWIGKNTLVMHQDTGSYIFLGAVVTTLEVAPDEPVEDHCGTCTACLDACPTDAFPAPYQMDASRCISYLTIEHRGDISKPFQEMMKNWVFGCDICQQVCPFNRAAPLTTEPAFATRSPAPSPDDILEWSVEDYRAEFAGSAMKRATLPMLQRNAAIVLQNARLPHSEATPNEAPHGVAKKKAGKS